MSGKLSKEAAKDFLYKCPLADQVASIYKELTGVSDIPVSGSVDEDTGVTVVKSMHSLVLKSGQSSDRYGIMLIANGENTSLLVIDPQRAEPSYDIKQSAQLVTGIQAGTFNTGEPWIELKDFGQRFPQRALEPKLHDFLKIRLESKFRGQTEVQLFT